MTLDCQVLVVAFLAISLRLVAMSFGVEGAEIDRSIPPPKNDNHEPNRRQVSA